MTREKAYKKFKSEICEKHETAEGCDEMNWYDLSVGFFLALKFPITEAHVMARKVRYSFKYWMD